MGKVKQAAFALAALALGTAAIVGVTAATLHLYLTHRPATENLWNESRIYGRLLMPAQTPRLRELGWIMLKPNARVYSKQREVRTNALGFRDLPQSLEKEEGVFRLVVIGDSYVYGQGIADVRNIFPHRMGLKELRGEKLNPLLMGYCGADLVVYNAMFHDMALQLDPDAVLVTLVSNDLEDAKNRSSTSCLPGPLQRLLRWSPALTAEAEQRCNLLTDHYSEALKRQFDPASETFRKEYASLEEMKSEADRRGIDLFAFFFHFMPDDYMDATYRRMAASLDIPYASLSPVAERLLEGGGGSLADFTVSAEDGHPNEFAHDLAGKAVAELLRDYYGESSGQRR